MEDGLVVSPPPLSRRQRRQRLPELRVGPLEGGLGSCEFRPLAAGGEPADHIGECGARRLAAQLKIIKGGTQFEQGGALAAGELKGRVEIGAAGGGLGLGAGPQAKQFGVVEVHPGVVGQLQTDVEAVSGLLGLAGGEQQPRDKGIEEGGIGVLPKRARRIHKGSYGLDRSPERMRVEVVAQCG